VPFRRCTHSFGDMSVVSETINTAIPAMALEAYEILIDDAVHRGANAAGTEDTPARAAKAWKELTSGYAANVDDIFKDFESNGYSGLVLQKNIEFFSLCEHHLLPFFGVAHVGYIPGKRIVGLSKLARIVDIYAKRLQTQERITDQVADELMNRLQPKGVGVVLEGTHLCMGMRGVNKFDAMTTTSALRGVILMEPDARAEYMSLVR